ncbi:MAG: MCE family protein [Thermoleophilaceae bacterium]
MRLLLPWCSSPSSCSVARGGGGYEVTAKFINAGQLVKGNPVQTGGTAIGTVKSIKITDDGQAAIRFSIKEDYAPLREGTRASIRQFSQSGIANRYIDLTLPPNRQREDPRRWLHRHRRHEDRGGSRPALQHARPAHRQGAAGLLQEPGAPVPRGGHGQPATRSSTSTRASRPRARSSAS